MHFYLMKNLISYQYDIFNYKVKLVFEFKNLGIVFDTKLNFSYR